MKEDQENRVISQRGKDEVRHASRLCCISAVTKAFALLFARCELFVSSDGSTEKLASGLLKPFVAHLRAAEEQVASAVHSVKLEVGQRKNAEAWFTKGTLERFVRFVSTPEVLELVNTLDIEMSQLEAARRIYSQGAGDKLPGEGGSGMTAADDATKKELLRAIDVRLIAAQQDLSNTCARAAAAGFNIDTVSELQMFADRFGAHRLNEACSKFISLSDRRPELINPWKSGPEDRSVRCSYGSDVVIDDGPNSPPPQRELSTSQQPNPPPITFPVRTFSRESSVEKDDGNKTSGGLQENDRKDESSTPDQTGPIQGSRHVRRLSVQDRINLFENKQKENSGGKPVVVKSVELRRMPSDISSSGAAAEKAVLRRWSGASDMSIDLSAERKDTETPLETSASAAVSQDTKVLILNDNIAKSSSFVKPEIKVNPSLDRISDSRLNNSEQFSESSKSNSNLGSDETDGLKDQVCGKSQSRSFISRADNKESSDEKLKSSNRGKSEGLIQFGDQGKLKGSQSGEELSQSEFEILSRKEDSESRGDFVKQIHPNATRKTVLESGLPEIGAGSRIREAFASRYKGIKGDSSSAQQEVISVGETEVAAKKASLMSEKVSNISVSSAEDSGPQRLKFNRQGLAAELSKKARAQRDKSNFNENNSRIRFSDKVVIEAQESLDSFSTPPPEQAQRVRQSKGNQELNDDLKIKANELEKLFAEHKSRAPADQSNSARKGRSGDKRRDLACSLHYTKPVLDIAPQLSDSYQSTEPTEKFDAASIMKTIDSQYHGDAIKHKFSDLSVSEGSRGNSFDKYMQKRDAKLREEWNSNRAEKETRLKSMQDSLERNRSQMKAKVSGSADRQDSVSSAHRRAERLRSYNRSSITKREQEQLDFGDSQDDEEAMNSLEQNHLHEDGAVDDTSVMNGVLRGGQGRKHLPNNRSSSSSTPRPSAAPIPRSATKTSTFNSGKRRMQPENPLAQSVPNFSDLRKENAKPSSAASKTTRSQQRNYTRSKSNSDEVAVKEDKSRRSQSMRKSSANPREFRDTSPLDSDDVNLTPIKFDEEVLKNISTKPFLKKGSRTGFAARASIARQKASVGSEIMNTEEENDDMASGPDDFLSTVKDERVEEFETLNAEEQNILDYGEPKLGLESDKFVNSGSENGDGTLTFSNVDQVLGSKFPLEPMQDWPEESPMSWNTHHQNPFSYPQEMSDVDASVYSPIGSPASWNSHSLNQIETDAARMRKKWGTAQKPMLDMTRGFKRLLKFGRKSRGSESLVDWISATTSEGDDDTEDGRDPANRSSEDLRKSRMGFSHAQPSDDGFSGSEFFNESAQSSQNSIPAPSANFKLREDHISGSSIKAPRSFFSLSTFRSKGSDSKAR
ncbi:hypothetical protein BUALT_Bualt02G0125900 [Buddleja alternifolia]|uniref:COP1-interacting protein 7 n=1 Tax=Buddleja alternifolia TaxID=168488 RepID=A0AAV6Y1T5_9LAMI|nr:hypothetical protein BUALT_Bualt02G0125900 [Buddleja alternifolia]